MSRWFRLYANAMRNPKVARLSDKDFRLWVRLLAVASENDGALPCLGDLKHLLMIRLDHLSTGVDRLISGGLIDVLETGYEPHGWKKFQYKSDTSTDRVREYRQKRNVSVTPPDTETDTETEVTVAKATVPRVSRGTRLPDGWRPTTCAADTKAGEVIRRRGQQWARETLESFTNHWRAKAGRDAVKVDWQATWANWVIEQDRRDGRNGKRGQQSATGYGRTADALADFVREAEAADGGGVCDDRRPAADAGSANWYEPG